MWSGDQSTEDNLFALYSQVIMKHFLFLADEWSSSKGGMSTINRELAKHLAKLPDVKVTFLVPPGSISPSERETAKSLGVSLVDRAGRGYVGFSDHILLCFLPEDLGDVDFVIGHGRQLGPQAQPIRDAKKCKWVHFVHVAAEDIGMFKGISEYEPKHDTELALCRAADLVVSIGSKLAEDYEGKLRLEGKDVHAFHPGLFEDFKQLPQARDPKNRHFIIVMFGRGALEDFDLKGYELVANAVADLGEIYKLKFVGAEKGKEEEVKNRLLEKSGISQSQLTVRSFRPDPNELKGMFCEAHLVIMPSQTEGFGLTALEALSAGVPILVSANSGFAEALQVVTFGDKSIFKPDDGPAALAKKIGNVAKVTHENRSEEACYLRKCYEKQYSWKKECEKLYTKICELPVSACSSWAEEELSNSFYSLNLSQGSFLLVRLTTLSIVSSVQWTKRSKDPYFAESPYRTGDFGA